jgi:hypothetical protein
MGVGKAVVGANLPEIVADGAEPVSGALCRMSSSNQIAGRGVSRPSPDRRQAKEVQRRHQEQLSLRTQCIRQHIARKYTHDDRIDAAPD